MSTQVDVKQIISTGKMLQSKKVKYRLGAKVIPPTIPSHLDCSGFVRYCYLAAGMKVPDGTYYQFAASEEIKDLQPGDIGFLQLPSAPGTNHIGIYIGDNLWMHCNYSRNGITIEKTNMFKYHRRFKGVIYKTEGGSNMVPVTDKELDYGIAAIERLADLKLLNSPNRHVEILKEHPEMWSVWVMLAKLAEK